LGRGTSVGDERNRLHPVRARAAMTRSRRTGSASLEHVQERAALGFDAVELGPVLTEDEHADGDAGEEGEDGGDHGLDA